MKQIFHFIVVLILSAIICSIIAFVSFYAVQQIGSDYSEHLEKEVNRQTRELNEHGITVRHRSRGLPYLFGFTAMLIILVWAPIFVLIAVETFVFKNEVKLSELSLKYIGRNLHRYFIIAVSYVLMFYTFVFTYNWSLDEWQQMYDAGKNALEVKNYKEAISYFDKTLELDSLYYHAYHKRGLAHRASGSIAKSIDDFSKAIEINPKYAKAYYDRGLSFAKSGDRKKAIQNYIEAGKLSYSYSIVLVDIEAKKYHNEKCAYLPKKRLIPMFQFQARKEYEKCRLCKNLR